MKHSIIVPCLNREQNLEVCLASIDHSAKRCGTIDYEVLIVGPLTGGILAIMEGTQLLRSVEVKNNPPVVLRANETTPYWKNHAINAGIEAATGDVLSFLDADAVVGENFMADAQCVDRYGGCAKLAYRVRYAEYAEWPGPWQQRFADYDSFPLAYEDHNGNSQYTILRGVLGDMRYDERYYGRSFDDLEMNRRLEQMGCKAYLATEPSSAMFHIKNQYSQGYNSDRFCRRNQRLYHNETVVWAFCDTRRAQFALADNGFTGRIMSNKDYDTTLCETIPGDTVLTVKEVTQ